MIEKEDTKQKLLSNLIWRLAERSGSQLVQLIVTIILARIIAPEVYGTIALITVFIAILQVLVDSGLGNALIQKKDADDLDFSTIFYTNIVLCLIIYTILFFCAPLIAKFYDNESLEILTRVLGLTIIIYGISNIQQAYVSKKLMFKRFFFATLIGTIISAIVGIIMALKGFEIWALVTQQLLSSIINTIVIWITVKWRPKKMFSFSRLKELFSYGWKLLVSSILDTGYNNIRQLIIGKIYTTADLAFYNKGNKLPKLIVNNINSSIDSVLFPTMSNVQDDRERVRNMTRRSIKISVFIMAPLMIGLAFTSKNVITILLTEKWLPCIPYLCIFCITYMFYPIHTANLNAIKAMGRSDLFLKLEILKKIVGIILLLLTMRISVKAMAYSLLISSVCSQIINSWPNKRLLKYSYISQLKDILPSIILAVFMGIIVYTINFLKLPIIMILIIQILVGGIVYILGAKLMKIDSFDYLMKILKERMKLRK